MKLQTTLTMLFGLGLSYVLSGTAQERGNWRAASKTAQSVTGDVAFGDEKLIISFASFPAAEIRPLKPEEIAAAFSNSDANVGSGHLIPSEYSR